MPTFLHEIRHGRKIGKVICGVDEVGRGPLAGPVVAAAVILPDVFPKSVRVCIRDSKKMSREQREAVYQPLTQNCCYAVAEASVSEIDEMNILWASMLAMKRAVALLARQIDIALVDGNRAPELDCHAVPLVRGDNKSLSIAAASIIAKVQRDRFMTSLSETFPNYGWHTNAGYGTDEHLSGLKEFGSTVWHRAHFSPVRALSARQA